MKTQHLVFRTDFRKVFASMQYFDFFTKLSLDRGSHRDDLV